MASITFKPGVDAANAHPSIWIAIGVAFVHHADITHRDLVITAIQGTDHMKGSYHDAANTPSKMTQAVDFRTIDIPIPQRDKFYEAVKQELDPLGYDIVHHTGADGLIPHLHVEYQPKEHEPDIFKLIGGANAFTPNRTEAKQS